MEKIIQATNCKKKKNNVDWELKAEEEKAKAQEVFDVNNWPERPSWRMKMNVVSYSPLPWIQDF